MSDRITIDVPDLEKATKRLALWSDQKRSDVRRAIGRGLVKITSDAKVLAPTGVSGQMRSQIAPAPDADGLGGAVIAHAAYSYWVEMGRGPGKPPPPDAMKLWVRRVLRLTDEREIDEAAYLIGQKIAREGTKKQPFMAPAARKNNPEIVADITNALKQL